MGRVEGMEILAARLASFELSHPAPKRRASSAKSAKSLSWPHDSPSPAELAHAGFFFKPSTSSPDNTVCFLCGKHLDGWEEEDDPVQEHVKHSPDCGWAIMTTLERLAGNERTAEDPAGSRMIEARRSTFTSVWPHEGKRGWTCKIEKMVEAGWYFCPTQESDDFVTCAYCNLCLDGWEPKDDPFTEHQNRSSSCRFFDFATKPASKRARKGRTSKSSRLSIQSNITTISESQSIPDLDISIDQSALSDISISTMSGSKKGKKASRAKGSSASTRGKGGGRKKYETTEINSSLIEIEGDDQSRSGVKSQRVGRGTKRTSDEMRLDEREREDRESTVKPQPPPKRRATRSSMARAQMGSSVLDFDREAGDPAISDSEKPQATEKHRKTGTKGGRKRASSTSRKATAISKASLQDEIPADSNIEAALESDLDKPLTDDEEDEHLTDPQAKPVKRSKARGSSNSTTTGRKGKRNADESQEEALQLDYIFESRMQDPAMADAQRMPTRRTRGSVLSVATSVARTDTDLDSSMVTARTVEDDSGHETDASMASKSTARKAGRKKAGGSRKGRVKKVTKGNSHKSSILQRATPTAEGVEKPAYQELEKMTVESPAPPESHSKPKRAPTGNQARAVTNALNSSIMGQAPVKASTTDLEMQTSHEPKAPSMVVASPPPKQTTPSPSPQPSDAENQPPSSRPSASRPPVFSPSRQETIRVPLAPSTPTTSPSKRNATLQSSLPWNAIDLEDVFLLANEDKENSVVNPILTSSEKKMTVEEWVAWNAENAENKLHKECDRMVGIFELEGGRAMRTLEGIECVE